MISHSLLGSTVFFVTNLSLLYTSHLLGRRFFPRAPHAVRLVGIGVLYYAFIVLVLQALSPLYAITRLWVTLVSLLIAGAAHLFWGRLRDISADINPVRSWIRDGLCSRWACLLVICGFVVLISFTRALVMPPLAWDCLTYHLTFAALWIKKGAIFLFKAPDQIATAAHLPINGELFAAWLLLPFHNDLIVNTMNFPITLLGGLACYAIARELGLSRTEASFAPPLICFAPMIYWQIVTEYVDSAAFAFYCSSVLFCLRYIRNSCHCDHLLALVAAGVLLGIKYTAVPAVGLMVLVTTLKTVWLPGTTGFLRKAGLISAGLLMVCLLGGRQYVFNGFEARNPLYPFPVAAGNHVLLQGADSLNEVNEWVSLYEAKKGLDKFGFWEREYREFLYLTVTAGPKFIVFLMLASVSLLIRPRGVSGTEWYFLALVWLVPMMLYHGSGSSGLGSGGPWLEGNTRYLAPFYALFTIQGLVVLKSLSRHRGGMYILLTAFVLWDLLMVNVSHSPHIETLYPFLLLAAVLLIVAYKLTSGQAKLFSRRGISRDRLSCNQPGGGFPSGMRLISGLLVFAVMTGGFNLLQMYRDNTRYGYFRAPTDLNSFQRISVDGWEFLDKPGEKKTIAMAMAWEPPGHKWILYPLLGRWLQNDIVYVSAKYRWDVPSWLDQGMLRGNDVSIWVSNLKDKHVDYVVVSDPIAYPFLKTRAELMHGLWPIELFWMKNDPDTFRLVYTDGYCRIFEYLK